MSARPLAEGWVMSRPSPYCAELRQLAVRMVAEVRQNYGSDWPRSLR